MLGRIVYVREPGRVEVEAERLAGLRLLRGTLREPEGMGPWRRARRRRKLARLLARSGVRRLILPDALPRAVDFAQFGRVDPLPFYRSVADLLALGCLDARGIAPGRAVVALSALRLCPELTAAAERLCPRVRALAIDVPGEGERYAAWLHREYGLPVSPGAGADVTVAFTPGGGRWGDVLDLSSGQSPDLCGLWVGVPSLDLPPDCAEPIQAALWERGMLDREALRVARVCEMHK